MCGISCVAYGIAGPYLDGLNPNREVPPMHEMPRGVVELRQPRRPVQGEHWPLAAVADLPVLCLLVTATPSSRLARGWRLAVLDVREG